MESARVIPRSLWDCSIPHVVRFVFGLWPPAAGGFARYRWRNTLAVMLIGVFIAEGYCEKFRILRAAALTCAHLSNNFFPYYAEHEWRISLPFFYLFFLSFFFFNQITKLFVSVKIHKSFFYEFFSRIVHSAARKSNWTFIHIILNILRVSYKGFCMIHVIHVHFRQLLYTYLIKMATFSKSFIAF